MRTAVESGSGLALDLQLPVYTQMALVDIVHALTMQPRLLGACTQRYSIAQHILLVHELLRSLQLPGWEKMFLQYFICRAHPAFIGDIPNAVRGMLAVQAYFVKLLAKLRTCIAQYIVAFYKLPEDLFRSAQAMQWGSCGVSAHVLDVVDAYETYHLMQGGGWSLQPDEISKKLRLFSEQAWEATKYRFAFDTPPRILPESAVQAELLKKLTAACATLRPKEEVAA